MSHTPKAKPIEIRRQVEPLRSQCALLQVMLSQKYQSYLWNVFVFPDSRRNANDVLTIPGPL